ncbi:MAG: LysR family transcriptional regulator [Gammaproteobacteria bacterium]|nr:LysR family transcriptional regulator [Gammaproteobacteria bacterium]MDH3416293.1 LysR family transcriptional regulator [Gammaproteobacteria bacterium]
MNHEAIRSLLLAAELGSFSAAGERLGVPPSTISRRVSELELDLGRKVLVRTGRGVRPTSDAREILLRLRDVLLAVDACFIPPAPMARLRVTAPAEMSISLLPGLLPDFRTKCPDVVVELRGENRTLGLIEEDFDLAIRGGTLVDSSYLSRKLPHGRFVAVANPAMAGTIQTLEQLAAAATIEVTGPSPGLSGRWRGRAFSIRSPAVAKFDSFTAALPMLISGDVYAAMPLHLVRGLVSTGKLSEISAAQLDSVTLHALYPRRHREQQAVSMFIDAVATALEAT